jgi:hypothetical protein
MGIPKYARDEKIAARNAKLQQDPEYHKRMEKLYRKHVLQEPEAEPLVQIGMEAAQTNANGCCSTASEPEKAEKREEVGAMGD